MRAKTALLCGIFALATSACTPRYMRRTHDTRKETATMLQQPYKYKGRQGGLIIPLERLQASGSPKSPVNYIMTRDYLLDQISLEQDSSKQQ